MKLKDFIQFLNLELEDLVDDIVVKRVNNKIILTRLGKRFRKNALKLIEEEINNAGEEVRKQHFSNFPLKKNKEIKCMLEILNNTDIPEEKITKKIKHQADRLIIKGLLWAYITPSDGKICSINKTHEAEDFIDKLEKLLDEEKTKTINKKA